MVVLQVIFVKSFPMSNFQKYDTINDAKPKTVGWKFGEN